MKKEKVFPHYLSVNVISKSYKLTKLNEEEKKYPKIEEKKTEKIPGKVKQILLQRRITDGQ